MEKARTKNEQFFYTTNCNNISPVKFHLRGETLWLSERRCIFWEEERMLIISDPHFGKTGHFRKEGINVPQKSFQDDLHKLLEVIQFFKPDSLVVTGDLFHSSRNKEVDRFFQWRKNFETLPVVLIKGNHDKFPDRVYIENGMEVHHHTWCVREFCFTHDLTTVDTDLYIFSGHIHPSVKIRGAGRQSLRLPCFYFGQKFAILPAFGNFTGTAVITPEDGAEVFAITPQAVIEI